MTISQKLIWTALPNKVDGAGLHLSVFLAPQLSGDLDPNGNPPMLNLFNDFVNWPTTARSGPLSFTVEFTPDGTTMYSGAATNETPPDPVGVVASDAWKAVFDPHATAVEPFTFEDYSLWMLQTFPVGPIADFIQSIYGTIGTISPTDPIMLGTNRDTQFQALRAGSKDAQAVVDALLSLADIGGTTRPTLLHSHLTPTPVGAFSQLHQFHAPLNNPDFTPPKPVILDFHQSMTSLTNYPVVLRLFNLVYDLVVPIPAGLPHGPLATRVIPHFTSSLGPSNTNVTPWTATTFSASTFRPLPQGPDYVNGMLALNDTTRFRVTDLDTDLAGDRLLSTATTLKVTQQAQQRRSLARYGAEAPGSSALTVPALRSAGPQVVWNNYAYDTGNGFSGKLQNQRALSDSLTKWLGTHVDTDLPVIFAEQLIRGHRIDVMTMSDATPTWRSLNGRFGHYSFGATGGPQISFTYLDEGMLSPAASQKEGTIGYAPQMLGVHESVIRWNGWGLSAQRPGTQLDRYANVTTTNPKNIPLPPSVSGPTAPQMSAYFTPPSPSLTPSDVAQSLLFPRLRFGNRYMFRARGVDLAGNSLPVTSTDATNATDPFTHYRHEPVRPPVMAGIAPFVPGEGTHYVIILNDQVSAPTTNGRWIFPPRVAQNFAEEHGVLDGFVFGNPADPSKPPAGDKATHDLLVGLDNTNLTQITDQRYTWDATTGQVQGSPIAQFDSNNQNVPYFSGSPVPWTPWFPDPLSQGPSLSGLPNLVGPLTATWNGTWPVADPMLLTLGAGGSPDTNFTDPIPGVPGTIAVKLPPAEVSIFRLSNALSADSLNKLGVWQWFGPGGDPSLVTLAENGLIWLLTPFQVVRMVHAVRVPLLGPAFQSPVVSRDPGSTSASLDDPQFLLDAKSTGHIDVAASWTDRYDDPNDPTSDPSALPTDAPARRSTITTGGPAFRLTVPDPTPLGAEAQPMTIIEPVGPFALKGSQFNSTHDESATHHIGDTKHHLVHYTATGASRFAEMFTITTRLNATIGGAIALETNSQRGLNPASVTVTVTLPAPVGMFELEPTEFTVSGLSVTINAGRAGAVNDVVPAVITHQPVTTLAGTPTPVHVLSSAPPKPPVISQVVPAWQIQGPTGSIKTGGVSLQRVGGFLRVYLERPWFTSGDGEMLGVVTTVTNESDAYNSSFPTDAQSHHVTMMGLDPINYVGASNTPWPVVPTSFSNLAPLPHVPYRPPYAHPPQVGLAEDPYGQYQVWPYAVEYDAGSDRWFADIAPRPGITDAETFPPPPGYFIRLALCRFQPYSTYYSSPTTLGPIEVSPVVLATFAQPVPDRSVSVIPNSADKTGKSVVVTVSGPAYQGWRPPQTFPGEGLYQYDMNNVDAPQSYATYGTDLAFTKGSPHTSTMVVQVQYENAALKKMGLAKDFVWTNVPGPVRLEPIFSDQTTVTWGGLGQIGGPGRGTVTLPAGLGSTIKMRLRISEIDYLDGQSAPSVIDTSLRRPFVTIIPLNYTP